VTSVGEHDIYVHSGKGPSVHRTGSGLEETSICHVIGMAVNMLREVYAWDTELQRITALTFQLSYNYCMHSPVFGAKNPEP
jgi:hypothetical protein